ncbi:MAG: translational GTPase TypA [Planctomycetota bacterium]|nr:translational GTPase TypA [Planctomycetota bacterium]MDA1112794.1 translational GTPase TypA [Planctomycetota bacterium]
MEFRNIAIIAHVDHGKTTLVDGLFKEAGTLERGQQGSDRVMDSNDLERERGITILSKNAALTWKGVLVNLIDTPGHADFGGQVERVLSMADGVLLVVDAFEGVMPQTRFVLQKAFENNLRPLVVVNKMDRQDARADAVLGEVFDLFVELGAEEMAIDFPVIYASARNGWASREEVTTGDNMEPMLDAILEHFDSPNFDLEGPLQYQVGTLDWDDYVGRIGIGRVTRGVLRQGDEVRWFTNAGEKKRGRVKELYRYAGMDRVTTDKVEAGDIASVAGMEGLSLGDTLVEMGNEDALPPITVEPPTIEMEFLVNDSPFAGKEGTFVTSRQVKERLERAAIMDPALRVTLGPSGGYLVAGRGVLHLGILIENMRREGFEFAVGSPRVLLKKDENGKTLEPMEEARVDVPETSMGKVIEFFGKRGAEISDMTRQGLRASVFFTIPTRGLIGARTQVLNLTKGEGVLTSIFAGYGLRTTDIETRHNGVLVSSDTGQCTTYSLRNLEDRGVFFVANGTPIYEGMVVGENNKDNDITVNIVRAKKMSNIRVANKDVDEKVRAPRIMGLEQYLEYLDTDELLEVTPQSLRLRKRQLNEKTRLRLMKSKETAHTS